MTGTVQRVRNSGSGSNILICTLGCIFLLIFTPHLVSAQGNIPEDTKIVVSTHLTDTLQSDSSKVIEDAPLDIAQNRGLFIVTPDRKMQLRLLGSVRYLVVFDNTELLDKNAFSTFDIATGDENQKLPNYFNGLNQTRIGFEVTRNTRGGNVFIRLETDFAGPDDYRIRHAYGQYRQFLLGQTWSLFSHITALPATVDFSGPSGSVTPRTPQIRYTFRKKVMDMNFAVGLEYTKPDLRIPDSLQVKIFQLIPDITARLDKAYQWGTLQVSGVIPVLSARNNDGNRVFKAGWGLSASVTINSWMKGAWIIQGVGGQTISRYITDLSGNGLDVVIDSLGDAFAPFSYGGYLTYGHSWRDNLLSSVSYSMARTDKITMTSGDSYHWGYTFILNTVWEVVEGARVGAEYIWGRRIDKGGSRGDASRVSFLFYYDF